MTFLPAYMGEKIHFGFIALSKVTLGGTVATMALVSGALGQYIGGRLTDRFRPEILYSCAIIIGTFFVFIMATEFRFNFDGFGCFLCFFLFCNPAYPKFYAL